MSTSEPSATDTACFLELGLFSRGENEFDNSTPPLTLLGEVCLARFFTSGTEKPSSSIGFFVMVMMEEGGS